MFSIGRSTWLVLVLHHDAVALLVMAMPVQLPHRNQLESYIVTFEVNGMTCGHCVGAALPGSWLTCINS